MATVNENAPSWADQWGTGATEEPEQPKTKDTGKKKTASKGTASASFDKAKAAAAVVAQKVKSGASIGVKWVKAQYQKRNSR